MTRINLIYPSELTTRHLIAEYRELPMVLSSLARTLNSKKGLLDSKINKEFTLNTGHVYFFYNKLIFLENRYNLLISEMRKRGIKAEPEKRKVEFDGFPEPLYQDWKPNKKEIEISRQRIEFRIKQKPHLYKDWIKFRS